MRKQACLGAALALLVVSSGCKLLKKKAGDACSGDEAVCLDPSTILECHDGKFAQMACKGAKGCAERHTGSSTAGKTVTHNYAVECDFTGNASGEPCLEDSALCSADKSTMITCKDKKISATKCMGPRQCTETAKEVDCDTTIQPAGGTCEGDDHACTPDKKQMLRCSGGKLVVGASCRGPKGCSVEGQKITCDTGPQNVGEPCSGESYECSTDKKVLLKCSGNKWVVDQKCGKKGCISNEHEAGCQS